MIDLVVDANIVVKWIIRDEQSDAADSLLARYSQDEFSIHVPDLLYVELASVLWKKVTRNQLLWDHALDATTQIGQYPFRNYETRGLFRRGLEIAHETRRSAYDCTYLALAESLGCRLATADERFYAALERTVFQQQMVLLADV